MACVALRGSFSHFLMDRVLVIVVGLFGDCCLSCWVHCKEVVEGGCKVVLINPYLVFTTYWSCV